MNSRPFALVRPLSQLLQATLLRQLHYSRWSMLLSDTVLHSGECDHVEHALLLAQVRDVWQHYGQRSAQLAQPPQELNSRSRTVNTDMITLDGHVTLPMLRRLLQGLQRYPSAHAATVAALETLLIDYVVRRVEGEHLTSEDINALWALAAQCRSWESVDRLLASCPLQDTLALQGEAQLDSLLGYVLRCPFTSRSADGKGEEKAVGVAPVVHRHKFLQDVIGPAAAWQHVGHLVSPAVAESHKALSERACSTCLLLAELTGEWPPSVRPPSPCAALHLPSLHALAGVLIQLHRRVVPAAVREALAPAVLQDLHQLYVGREVWATVRLLLYGAQEIAQATGTDPLPLLRSCHTALLEQLLAPSAGGGAPLDQRTLLHLLLGDALLQPGAPVAAEQLSQLLLAKQEGLLFHQAVYLCVALEALRGPLGPSSETYQQLLARAQGVLTASAMADAASGRLVSLLLLHAPTVCTEDLPSLGACCDRLLVTHAGDGFTRRQLDDILQVKGDALQVVERERVAVALRALPVREDV